MEVTLTDFKINRISRFLQEYILKKKAKNENTKRNPIMDNCGSLCTVSIWHR